MNGDGPHDLSAYEHVHFDLWAPFACKIKVSAEDVGGAGVFKDGIVCVLQEGWNAIDADAADWKSGDVAYEWKTLKCIVLEQFQNLEGVSIEGNPFAFANMYFWSETTEVTPPDVDPTPKPEVAPAKPTLAEENVMALYSNHYQENNLNFSVTDFSGTKDWETLELGDDKTKVLYTESMTWAMFTNWDKDSYDFSGYEKFHFDVWVPFAAHVKVTFEAQSGWKNGIDFLLREGWNTIDADPAWWITEDKPYDWKDVKYIAFEQYKKADAENLDECSSAEGNPFAFANLYWWNTPAPQGMPDVAPAAPTMAEADIQALISSTYKERNFNFAPASWGSQWIDYAYENGQHIWFAEKFYWDGFEGAESSYDLNAYDMMHVEVYVTVDSKIRFTFEALKADEGGSGWRNGTEVTGLKANEWNKIDIDLLNAPFDDYEFKDLRYLIVEGFKKTDDSSAEGTPLAIANVYFWNSLTPVENTGIEKIATKRLENGHVVIEMNGVRYNVLGAQF